MPGDGNQDGGCLGTGTGSTRKGRGEFSWGNDLCYILIQVVLRRCLNLSNRIVNFT